MTGSVNVRSLSVVAQLRESLQRFSSEAGEPLVAMERQIRATLEWLQERQAYWKREVRLCEQAVMAAREALRACEASGDDDYEPDCSAESAALREAEAELREAQKELKNVQRWINVVQGAVVEYQREARQFALFVQELPKAIGLLGQKISILHRYVNSGMEVANLPETSPSGHQGQSARAAGGWSNLGIRTVSISNIDVSDSPVHGAADFHKVSEAQMIDGLKKLRDVVQPAVEAGHGADYFRRLDAEQRLPNELGYLRVFEAFYGQDAITLARLDAGYDVINGYHRLFLARQLGFNALPARIIGNHGT